MSELVDEHDLGSCALKGVGVRVSPSPFSLVEVGANYMNVQTDRFSAHIFLIAFHMSGKVAAAARCVLS